MDPISIPQATESTTASIRSNRQRIKSSSSVVSVFALQPESVATLQVQIQLTRLLLGTVVTTLLVVSLVVCLGFGVTLLTIDADAYNTAVTDGLVDDYNSYSANVASAVGRPISVAVGLVTQIVLLRFVTALFLDDNRRRWHLRVVLLLSVAVLEYLVLNGFNAINVQLRPLPVHPVISKSDLSLASSGSNAITSGNITNVTDTYSEKTAANPITNTVLRNLLLPHAARQDPSDRKCTDRNYSMVNDDSVVYGIPARTWQREMVPKALESSRLRVPADNSSHFNVQSRNSWPMDASRAASIFANSVYMSSSSNLGWFFGYLNAVKTDFAVEDDTSKAVSLTELLGLLPDEQGTEDTQWEHLIQRTQDIVTNHLFESKNLGLLTISEDPLALEFARVSLTPTINFDAVTFEVQLSEEYFPRDGNVGECGAEADVCLFGAPSYGFTSDIPDVQAGVIVLGACGDHHEDDVFFVKGVRATCTTKSKSSLFVVTIGKHLVADALDEGDRASTRSAKNLRKIYTFTFGRLEWATEDLADMFNAECAIQDEGKCDGLAYNLSDKAVLVTSSDELPLAALSPISNVSNDVDLIPLVRVLDPPAPFEESNYGLVQDSNPGYILLPHNIKTHRKTSTPSDDSACYSGLKTASATSSTTTSASKTRCRSRTRLPCSISSKMASFETFFPLNRADSRSNLTTTGTERLYDSRFQCRT